MGRSTEGRQRLSERRKYRSWTAKQKIEIVLAGLRGDRSVKEVCREHEISETLYYSWREKLLEGGRQQRLATEIAQAERHLETAEQSFGEIQATLDKALDLLANCERAYRKAPGHLRRRWNLALFERLLVHDDRVEEAEVAEPFATLADPELPRRLEGNATEETAASSGGGSNEALKVGATGFEPATFRPPAECATRLRHAPGFSVGTLARP